MQYLGVKETAEKWGITRRRVQLLCAQKRIEGACKVGNSWAIPVDANQPQDARLKIYPISEQTIPSQPLFERAWAMPNKNTFSIKPIRRLLEEEMTDGLWIDPFANTNKLANITNDLNPEYDTDYHLDALDFLKMFDDNSVDGVLYDPPFSPRQVSECYNNVGYNVTWDTTKASFWGNHKREMARIIKTGGKVISFGWNSGGVGIKHGFAIDRILLVPHGGWHNDTICTVETKIQATISLPKLPDAGKAVISQGKETMNTDTKLIETLNSLPFDYWDFKTDDTRAYTHGLHTYPAMMVYPISRNIIRIMKGIMDIDVLFDPFAGSGTVLVEGMLAGIPHVIGNDINPLALFLSRVKTSHMDVDRIDEEITALDMRLNVRYATEATKYHTANAYFENDKQLDLTDKHGWGSDAPQLIAEYCSVSGININVPDFKNIGYWFKPSVILELAVIKEEIAKVTDANMRDFLLTAFSESIRLVSNRRNGEFKMFRMPADKVRKHSPDVLAEFLNILRRNQSKYADFCTALDEADLTSDVVIFNNSTCRLSSLKDESVDLVVTSPPYGDSRTTVAYGEFSRLSLQWLNLCDSEKQTMGIDRSLMGGTKYRNGFEYTLNSDTLKSTLSHISENDIERAGDVFSFYSDIDKAISEISRATRSGGYHFWVVGNRTVKGEVLMTDRIITELAASHRMDFVHSVGRNISNKVMPSLNSPTNKTGKKSATMTNEHIVILRKQ